MKKLVIWLVVVFGVTLFVPHVSAISADPNNPPPWIGRSVNSNGDEGGWSDPHARSSQGRNEVSINDNSLAGRLTKKIKQELATEESRKQSLRVREQSKMRASEGFRVGGFAPYGFKRLLVKADGTPIRVLEHGERKYEKHHRVILTPGDPREIKVVCQMFSMKAGGSSIRDVLEWLNSNRVPAPSRDRLTTSRNAPGRWWINAVYVILTNPVYCGDTVYNKQVRGNRARLDEPGLNRRNAEGLVMVSDSHEGIVSRDIFLTVQASLSQDKRPRKSRSWKESPYLLSD